MRQVGKISIHGHIAHYSLPLKLVDIIAYQSHVGSRYSSMAELLIPVRFRVSALRVAQSTLLPFDLGIERQTVWSSLYFRWGCYGSIHEPSLSAMTLNYISFYFYLSLVIMTGLLYYMDEVKIKC